MEMINQTKLNVEFVSGSPDLRPDVVVGQLVGKALGFWDPQQRFQMDWDAKAPILRENVSTDWGELPCDLHQLKEGCDLSVVGRVYSPDPKGCKEMDVEIMVGDLHRSLRVFGPRRWVPSRAGDLVPEKPQMFGITDMVWSQSFGGRCEDQTGELQSDVFNPSGKGFQCCPKNAEGTALPSIEDPEQLIRGIDDRPMPINLAAIPADLPLKLYPDPTIWGQALLAGERVKLPASYHNVAHPKFRIPRLRAGAAFSLRGMDTQGGLCGALPSLHIHAEIRLGDRRHECFLRPSNLVFFPETRHLSISYSAHFAFRWVPEEQRSIHLRAMKASF